MLVLLISTGAVEDKSFSSMLPENVLYSVCCCQAAEDSKDKRAMFDEATPEAMRYLQRVVDEVLAVLFDSRRQSCHGLVLNNFVSCSGFKQLLAKFQMACQCLFTAVDNQEAQPAAGSPDAKANGKGRVCQVTCAELLSCHCALTEARIVTTPCLHKYACHDYQVAISLCLCCCIHLPLKGRVSA